MDHEIEVIRHCSSVVFKFAVFRGTHLPGGNPHDRGRNARRLNFEIWSLLRVSGAKAITFSHKGLF